MFAIFKKKENLEMERKNLFGIEKETNREKEEENRKFRFLSF